MPRPGRSLLVAGLAAVLGLTVLAPGAQAAKKTFSDTRSDVRVVTVREQVDPDDFPPSRASRTEVGDVLRTAVSNGPGSVGVRIRFAELRRSAGFLHQVLVAGSNGNRREVIVDTTSDPRGEVTVFDGEAEVVCARSVRHRLDYRAETLSVAIPRSCIGEPRRVRVALSSVLSRPNDGAFDIIYDEGFRRGGEPRSRNTFSAPVRRG